MSSDNYAGRLSEYHNKGICGLPEAIESKRSMDYKVAKLIKMVQSAEYIVVLSGAGISTNAGIPDFRGPNGIWTAEEGQKKKLKNGKRRKKNEKLQVGGENIGSPSRDDRKRAIDNISQGENSNNMVEKNKQGDTAVSKQQEPSFESATPTITHRLITKLVEMDVIKYVITQNVDGLHRRSGLSRKKLSVLHGCIFTEKCEKCHKEYFRDFDVGGVSFKKTGRKCVVSGCDGDLRDTILDWEDELPDEDWELSQQHCAKSDLVLAIGTSLRIEPAGSLPTYGKKFVIINKQETPYDSKADLIIRADVDTIFSRLMNVLDK